jgi:hypothetical protein
MWGAKSGREQLPAFPEPTHRTFGLTNRGAKQFCSDGVDQVNCRVDFLHPHAERRNAAHPPVRAGCFVGPSRRSTSDRMSRVSNRLNLCLQGHLSAILWEYRARQSAC